MIFDTDIFIWYQRGNDHASRAFDASDERYLSVVTCMELLQGAQNKKQHAQVQDFLTENGFIILPLSENIGHRALIYIEEYAVTHGLHTADAIIAATAVENNLALMSSNVKHFKPIKDLQFKPFRP